jgi:hypothetical protein
MSDQYEGLAISPDAGFENRLRIQIDTLLNAPVPIMAGSANEIEVVALDAQGTRARRRHWRVTRIAIAVAASIALLFAVAIIVTSNNDQRTASELHDVDPTEALPLAQNAFITSDALGSRWRLQDMFTESMYTQQTAATIAARPECAVLRSMGLFTPTTKSVAARQSFSPGRNFVGHTVLVFASEEDASRAMDVIAGDVYPACWFDFFDRLIPLGATLGTSSSTSEAWDLPAITQHGDRQIVIGQHSTLVAPDATVEAYFVNAYVQVGRAISWINPMTGPTSDGDLVSVNRVITATATALATVFGG